MENGVPSLVISPVIRKRHRQRGTDQGHELPAIFGFANEVGVVLLFPPDSDFAGDGHLFSSNTFHRISATGTLNQRFAVGTVTSTTFLRSGSASVHVRWIGKSSRIAYKTTTRGRAFLAIILARSASTRIPVSLFFPNAGLPSVDCCLLLFLRPIPGVVPTVCILERLLP